MDKSKSAPYLKEEGIENSRAIIITEPGEIDQQPRRARWPLIITSLDSRTDESRLQLAKSPAVERQRRFAGDSRKL
jgi:hypothetical protein